jgi:transcriptional regulator with XRE-family HTH domain
VGVTFQQVQKYEKGLNRASAGRLQQIAGVLGVPLSSFLDELAGEDGPASREIISVLKKPGAADLLRAYASVSPESRRRLLQMARELASNEERPLRPARAKGKSKRA